MALRPRSCRCAWPTAAPNFRIQLVLQRPTRQGPPMRFFSRGPCRAGKSADVRADMLGARRKALGRGRSLRAMARAYARATGHARCADLPLLLLERAMLGERCLGLIGAYLSVSHGALMSMPHRHVRGHAGFGCAPSAELSAEARSCSSPALRTCRRRCPMCGPAAAPARTCRAWRARPWPRRRAPLPRPHCAAARRAAPPRRRRVAQARREFGRALLLAPAVRKACA